MAKKYLDVLQPNEKGPWSKIGVAFPNEDGSINVQLRSFPVDGKCQLREPREKEVA
jgi:hypothetical protein